MIPNEVISRVREIVEELRSGDSPNEEELRKELKEIEDKYRIVIVC